MAGPRRPGPPKEDAQGRPVVRLVVPRRAAGGIGRRDQIATLTLAAAHRAPWTLFAASALALVAASAMAVLAGGFVARWVSPVWLARVGGTLSIVLGAWTLWSAGRAE